MTLKQSRMIFGIRNMYQSMVKILEDFAASTRRANCHSFFFYLFFIFIFYVEAPTLPLIGRLRPSLLTNVYWGHSCFASTILMG